MIVGLRVDVDTLRGTRGGVPALLETFARHDLRASFFFSVGPDNMGRHLWRLAHPTFLAKMLRTRAASLYGWDILLRGTFWPGQRIGKRCADIIRETAARGHEAGLHAWDHHAWQAHLDGWGRREVHQAIWRGVECLTDILGDEPVCSAVPGWRCNDLVLEEKARFPFSYNSDCRGQSMFLPTVGGRTLAQVQIPTTLPTYDELRGRDGIDDGNYNARLLQLLRPGELNVLTIHAEVEGLAQAALFDDFLDAAEARGIHFARLGELLPRPGSAVHGTIAERVLPGRQGPVAVQELVQTDAASIR